MPQPARRSGPQENEPGPGQEPAAPRPWRRVVAGCATALAVALVWFALVAPTRPDRLTPGAVLRLPVEAVVLAAVVLVVAARPTRALTVVVGAVLAVVTLLKVLDVGAFAVLDRPFNVVTDRGQLGSGVDFVRDSLGPWAARGSVLAAVALVGALFVGLPWAVGRLTAVAARHRRAGVRAVVALGVVWGVCAVSGLQLAPGGPVAAADTGPFVVGKVRAASGRLP